MLTESGRRMYQRNKNKRFEKPDYYRINTLIFNLLHAYIVSKYVSA